MEYLPNLPFHPLYLLFNAIRVAGVCCSPSQPAFLQHTKTHTFPICLTCMDCSRKQGNVERTQGSQKSNPRLFCCEVTLLTAAPQC